jgi:serine protease
MLRRLLAPIAAAAALLAAAPDGAAASAFVPGEVIVRYQDDVAQTARRELQRRTGTAHDRTLPGGSRTLAIRDGESVAATIEEVRADPRVEYAVPNYIAHASFVPNDPGFTSPGGWRLEQWNFDGPASINAPQAWDIARAAGAPGGRGAVVAVLDTGVAYERRGRFRRAPDLYHNRFLRGYDFVDDDRYPNDENGHGTHVTGTIAQRVNNGVGLTGLAYGAKVLPVRVLDERGDGDADSISRGIRYAAQRGADVINLSLEFDAGIGAAQVPEIVAAVRYAHSRGAVIFAAAGNQGSAAVAYPARTRYVISVAGTTERGCQADYSNSGAGLDLAAPGGGEDATNVDNEWDAAHCRPNERGRPILQQTFARERRPDRFGYPRGYKGTSMASPHVAAAAALLIASGRLGPDPTPVEIEERLKATARDAGPPGYDIRYGAGLIDAAAALGP